jgi:hypothetical protein
VLVWFSHYNAFPWSPSGAVQLSWKVPANEEFHVIKLCWSVRWYRLCRWAVSPVFCVTLRIHLIDLTAILLNFRHLLLQHTLLSLVLSTVYTLKLCNLQHWISATTNCITFSTEYQQQQKTNNIFAQTVINFIIIVIITWQWQGIFETFWATISKATEDTYMHIQYIFASTCVRTSPNTLLTPQYSPLWLSQLCVWWFLSPGMWHCITVWVVPDIMGHNVEIFR